ncbi:MAG: TetR/AcrR family transcriptional regulator [Solirubrobacterales bacterium]
MRTISRRDESDRQRGEVEDSFILATEQLLAGGSPFADLSVGRIAEHAGRTRTAFYFYFRDKRDLLVTIMRRVASTLFDQADVWWSGTGDPRDLRVAMQNVIRIYDERGPVIGAVVEASTYDDEIRRLWHEIIGRFIAATHDRIIADGGTAEAARTKAHLLVWMTERVCYLRVIAPPGDMAASELVEGLYEVWTSAIYTAG